METNILSNSLSWFCDEGHRDAADDRDDADMGYISHPVKMTVERAIQRFECPNGGENISHEQAEAYAKGYNEYLCFK